MHRRGFLARLAALPVAGLLALRTPVRPSVVRPQLEIPRLPDSVLDWSTARGNDAGISIRYVKQYVMDRPGQVARFDVLFGMANVNPQFSVRVAS